MGKIKKILIGYTFFKPGLLGLGPIPIVQGNSLPQELLCALLSV